MRGCNMNLNRLSFQQLYRLQHQTNIIRFLDGRHPKALAICQSREVEEALIAAARSTEVPRGAPIRYAQVFRRELVAACERVDRHMLCRAGLIMEHCHEQGAQFHSLREFDSQDPMLHRIEVWIESTPDGCAMLRYRRGLTRERFTHICNRLLCSAAILCPYLHTLKAHQCINPANNFPATPDCKKTWEQMVRYAN